MELSALGDVEVEAIAEACLGTANLPSRLVTAISQWAEGVPFLVEEILATLVSVGALRAESGGWIVEEAPAPVLPQSFVQSVQERLDAVGDNGRRVVQAGALLGLRFDWGLLSTVTGLPEGTVLACLRRAVESHLLASILGTAVGGEAGVLWQRARPENR